MPGFKSCWDIRIMCDNSENIITCLLQNQPAVKNIDISDFMVKGSMFILSFCFISSLREQQESQQIKVLQATLTARSCL